MQTQVHVPCNESTTEVHEICILLQQRFGNT